MSAYTFNLRYLDANWWSLQTLAGQGEQTYTIKPAWGMTNPVRWYSPYSWTIDEIPSPNLEAVIYGPTPVTIGNVGTVAYFEQVFSNVVGGTLGDVTLNFPAEGGLANGCDDVLDWAASGYTMTSTATFTTNLVNFFGGTFKNLYGYPDGTNFNLLITRGTPAGYGSPCSAAFCWLGNDPNNQGQSTYTF